LAIDRYNRATSEMIAPKIIWDQADGSVRFIVADRGIYTNGQWVFYNVEDWVPPPARRPTPTRRPPKAPGGLGADPFGNAGLD
jgi:hypothetical protein